MDETLFKRIHSTLETWCGNRRRDGWKYSDSEWSRLLDHLCHGRKESTDKYNVENNYIDKSQINKKDGVKLAKRLQSDLMALKKLITSERSPSRILRGDNILVVYYGFEDASGNGFEETWNKQNSSEISYRFGIWDEEDNEGKYSNY